MKEIILEYKEYLVLAGAAIAWIATQVWKYTERRDKLIKDNLQEIKIKKKLELTDKAMAVNEKLVKSTMKAMDNENEIRKGLMNIVYGHNAAHSSIIKLHDGGDHISEWSKKQVTMVDEQFHPTVEPVKKSWQGVPLLPQLRLMMEQVYTSEEKYLYYHDYLEAMPDGEFKMLLHTMHCFDFAIYYVGCAGPDIFFTMFQFRKNGVQSEREKIMIKQFSQSTGIKLFQTHLEQQALKKEIIKIEQELLKVDDLSITELKKPIT